MDLVLTAKERKNVLLAQQERERKRKKEEGREGERERIFYFSSTQIFTYRLYDYKVVIYFTNFITVKFFVFCMYLM